MSEFFKKYTPMFGSSASSCKDGDIPFEDIPKSLVNANAIVTQLFKTYRQMEGFGRNWFNHHAVILVVDTEDERKFVITQKAMNSDKHVSIGLQFFDTFTEAVNNTWGDPNKEVENEQFPCNSEYSFEKLYNYIYKRKQENYNLLFSQCQHYASDIVKLLRKKK